MKRINHLPHTCHCGMPLCYEQCIAIYDRDLDCTKAYQCKTCNTVWPLPLAQVLSVADPAAFKEVK